MMERRNIAPILKSKMAKESHCIALFVKKQELQNGSTKTIIPAIATRKNSMRGNSVVVQETRVLFNVK